MGIRTIQAKRAELQKQVALGSAFIKIADELNQQRGKIEKAVKDIDGIRATIADKVKGLDAVGIRELDDYKKSLESLAFGSSAQLSELIKMYARPLPTTPLQAAINRQSVEIDKKMSEWVQKHAASFPKEIKVGMTFKGPDGSVGEVTTIGNHVYELTQVKDGKVSKTIVEKPKLCLQGGYKYVQV